MEKKNHFIDKKVIEKKNGVAHPKIAEDNLLQRLGLSMDLLGPRVTCLVLACYFYYYKGKINTCKHIHRDETLEVEFNLSKDL